MLITFCINNRCRVAQPCDNRGAFRLALAAIISFARIVPPVARQMFLTPRSRYSTPFFLKDKQRCNFESIRENTVKLVYICTDVVQF